MKRLLFALALCLLGMFWTGDVRADHRWHGGGHYGYHSHYRHHSHYVPHHHHFHYRSYQYPVYRYRSYGYPVYGYPSYGYPYGYGYGSYYRGPGVSLYFRF